MSSAERARILALVLAVALLAALLAFVPFGRVRFWAMDVGCYRAAALALRNGADPYALESLLKYADGASLSPILRYTYPPAFLLFVLPLTWLPLYVAVRAWLILNLFMLAAAVVLLSKALAWELSGKRFLVLMLGAVASWPVIHCLAFGQASIFVLFWLAAAFYCIKRERDVWAGVCLSICFAKLQVLAFVPLVLLLQRRWRLVGSWALAFALSLLPFWGLWPSWLEAVVWTTEANDANLGYYGHPCLNGLGKVLFADPLPRTLFTGITTLSVFAVVAWVGATRGTDRASLEFDRVFGFSIAASSLAAGYVRTHDQVLLLVPMAILLNEALRAVTARRKRVALVAVGLAYLFPYFFVLLSPFAFILRTALFFITSTLSVLIGLLVLLRLSPQTLPIGMGSPDGTGE